MLEYEFMRNAFMAGAIVAIVGGAVGFFLVLRSLAFRGRLENAGEIRSVYKPS